MRVNGDLLIDDDLTVTGDVSGNLNADQLVTGTVADARLPATIVRTNDARLTDARTPTAHANSHMSGVDPIYIYNLLGFPDNTTQFLRADATWAAPPSGGTPGGSTTQVQFNDGGAFGGSANFVFDKTTTRVGIGITPACALDVAGAVRCSGSLAQTLVSFAPSATQKALVGMAGAIKGTAATDLGLFAETGGGISFMVNGSATDVLTITTAGDLVCGASATIRRNTSDGADNGYLYLCGGGGAASSRGSFLLLTGNEQAYSGAAILNCGDNPNAYFQVNKPNGTAGFQIDASYIRLSDTPVLITPNCPTAATAMSLDLTNVASGSNGYQVVAPAAWTGNLFVAWRGSTAMAVINQYGIGNFGANRIQVGNALDILGYGSGNDGAIYAPAGGPLWLHATSRISSLTIYNLTDSTSANLTIDSSGKLARFTSSRRYKTAIEPLTDWRWILDLTPVTFDPIKRVGERRYGGLLAEDVAEHSPQAYGHPLFAVLDDQGRPDEVAYDHLHAPVIAAIQDLHARLAALEGSH